MNGTMHEQGRFIASQHHSPCMNIELQYVEVSAYLGNRAQGYDIML